VTIDNSELRGKFDRLKNPGTLFIKSTRQLGFKYFMTRDEEIKEITWGERSERGILRNTSENKMDNDNGENVKRAYSEIKFVIIYSIYFAVIWSYSRMNLTRWVSSLLF
jgi:hypothetical protein